MRFVIEDGGAVEADGKSVDVLGRSGSVALPRAKLTPTILGLALKQGSRTWNARNSSYAAIP